MRTILLADDNKAFRQVLSEILAKDEHMVVEAANGDETLKIIRESDFRIDLLLLDLSMPKKDGFGVLGVLNQFKHRIKFPILVMSGFFRSLKDIERVKKLGASGFIDKTTNLDEFVYRINQALNPVTEELRATPRTAITILVQYRIDNYAKTAYTFNISEGGIFIRMMNPPELHKEIHVRFSLPTSKELIKADGTIAWRNEYNPDAPKLYPPGIGIKFTNIRRKDQAFIKQFILQMKQVTNWKIK